MSTSYPSGNLLTVLLLNMAIEIVDLPIENGGSFHSFLYVYQRVRTPPSNSKGSHILLRPNLAPRESEH